MTGIVCCGCCIFSVSLLAGPEGMAVGSSSSTLACCVACMICLYVMKESRKWSPPKLIMPKAKPGTPQYQQQVNQMLQQQSEKNVTAWDVIQPGTYEEIGDALVVGKWLMVPCNQAEQKCNEWKECTHYESRSDGSLPAGQCLVKSFIPPPECGDPVKDTFLTVQKRCADGYRPNTKTYINNRFRTLQASKQSLQQIVENNKDFNHTVRCVTAACSAQKIMKWVSLGTMILGFLMIPFGGPVFALLSGGSKIGYYAAMGVFEIVLPSVEVGVEIKIQTDYLREVRQMSGDKFLDQGYNNGWFNKGEGEGKDLRSTWWGKYMILEAIKNNQVDQFESKDEFCKACGSWQFLADDIRRYFYKPCSDHNCSDLFLKWNTSSGDGYKNFPGSTHYLNEFKKGRDRHCAVCRG